MILKTALASLFVAASPAAAMVKVVRVVPAIRAPLALPFVAPQTFTLTPSAALSASRAPSADLSAILTPSLSVANDAASPATALAAPADAPVAKALTLVEAIATAENAAQALVSLVELGVIKPGDVPAGATDRVALLKRVWDGVAEKRDASLLPIDDSWAVPAIKVERGGKTYFVHGVAHGQIYPPNRRDVSRLVAQIKDKKQALYSEQGLPIHYGFDYGLETQDREMGESNGVPTRVIDAARGLFAGGIPAVHALLRWAAVGGVGYSWVRAAFNAADPLVWALAVGLTAGLWLLKRGLQPLYRLKALAEAKEADKLGSPHIAANKRREAAVFYGPRVAAEDILRLHLPPGPGAAADSLSPRSIAIAAAAAASAAAVVHILVGYRHAAEIAWRLAGKEGPKAGPTPE